MKNIELTEDHKSKLLEMCKVLFPEWTFITFQESASMGAWEYEFNNLCLSKKSNDLYDIEENIHWFEFCWTLLNKILESNLSPIKSCEIIKEFGLICFNKFESLHPVNYLYEQFLKLK